MQKMKNEQESKKRFSVSFPELEDSLLKMKHCLNLVQPNSCSLAFELNCNKV